MEYLSKNKAYQIFGLSILSLVILTSCQSTETEVDEANCSTTDAENCPAEPNNGEDRGYNPCLVNKALPVCKK
jgi:hypothetical protein